MYEKVDTDLRFAEREQKVLEFWRKNRIFEKTLTAHEGAPAFSFFDGPPTANGKPHVGHLETRSFKDLFPRYKYMQGYDVLRKAGWDTHGLPVELEVEKLLGLDGKEQIEEYGVEPFIQQCKESVWKYKKEWEEMSERIAFWADMEDPYVTYENNYIESEWWSLKQLYDKGLIYKGYKVVPYCPRCGTALSSHEVAQGYKDVKEKSAIAKFRVAGKDNTFLLAWTTTPWTLPSNLGLCVNAKEEYATVLADGVEYILAKALVETHFGEDANIVNTCLGSDLVGTEYVPVFELPADVKLDAKAFFVVADPYVTLTEGTGIVHIAPAYGEDDNRICRANGLPFVNLVNAKGEFVEGTPWAGVFVKDADAMILKALEESGLLFKALDFEHSYPFCWRCDTPLLYYARSSWFIEMTKLHDELMANNRAINWMPENVKEGRMGNFLDNVIDWGLSRERYWGTPLPIWECECGHRECIGSIAELKEKGIDVPDDIELHKPYIDAVHLTCPHCGKEMKRVPEVIDCWYDSGSMPFAQWHYPFENKDKFEKFFPANFISEAVDQTRGWFYTLSAISTALFGKPSFENCLVMGHVQDKDGQKMSKHKGNVVDPWSVLNKQGADAVRWFFYVSAAPWLPNRFHDAAITEAQRKFMGTLWNTYAFYVLYANIDNYNPYDPTLPEPAYTVMDKWVLSRMHSLIKQVTEDMDAYRVTEAARAMTAFVDELSNWYIRRGRERYWGKEMTADKAAAYKTLYTVLSTMAKLSAPFVPFMAESIYLNIVKTVEPDAPESVHMCAYPVADEAMIDEALMEEMDFALKVVTIGRSARNASGIKNRQPIASMLVSGSRVPSDLFREIILEELNVKAFESVDDASEYIAYQIKPQMRTLGPKFGKLLPKIGNFLRSADGSAIVAAMKNEGKYAFEIEGSAIELGPDDILVSTMQKEGFSAVSENGITVVLDTALTDELIAEGYVREIVSKVQTMRKEADYNVTDHIRVAITTDEELSAIVEANKNSIMEDVLCDELCTELANGFSMEWDINGKKAVIAIERI
ncbi:MAG: isoleucine--tRNA ligase [Clostridiales bacterium]|nr:isoleucine--tRNA ligase [Clostridiales bacterium]